MWSVLASCVAGTLWWVAASIAEAQSDKHSISATTMLTSAFHATGLTKASFSRFVYACSGLCYFFFAGTLLWAAASIALPLADTRAQRHDNGGVSILQAFHPPQTASTHHLRPYGCFGCRGTTGTAFAARSAYFGSPRSSTAMMAPPEQSIPLYGQELGRKQDKACKKAHLFAYWCIPAARGSSDAPRLLALRSTGSSVHDLDPYR